MHCITDLTILSLGGLFTAFALRYEHSFSKHKFDLHASENEKPAPLAQMEEGVPATTYSIEEAFAARVPIPRDRPRFAKPLFHILLIGIFVVHIPGIVLSALLTYELVLLDSTLHPTLNAATKAILSFPSQTWAIILHPFLVGIACLVRKDGAALWRYHEMIAKPLEPAQAQTVDVTKSPTKAEKQVQTQLVDSDEYITKENLYKL